MPLGVISGASVKRGSPASETHNEGGVQVSFPLQLQLAGSVSGGPDLRLQLLTIKGGTACERPKAAPIAQRTSLAAGELLLLILVTLSILNKHTGWIEATALPCTPSLDAGCALIPT